MNCHAQVPDPDREAFVPLPDNRRIPIEMPQQRVIAALRIELWDVHAALRIELWDVHAALTGAGIPVLDAKGVALPAGVRVALLLQANESRLLDVRLAAGATCLAAAIRRRRPTVPRHAGAGRPARHRASAWTLRGLRCPRSGARRRGGDRLAHLAPAMKTTTAPDKPIRSAADHVTFLPLAELHESATNPRRTFDKQLLAGLAESVKVHGVLQPLLVRVRAKGGHEVVAGARRLRAAKAAALLEVPCFVRDLDDQQVLEIQYVENLQRDDLHPLDEGLGYHKLHTEHGYSVEDLAGKLGKSKAYVYGRMQLGKLPVKAQTLFFEGKIDLSHAQLVARIPVPELADQAAAAIAKGDPISGTPMTYRRAAEHVRRNFQCVLSEAPFDTADANLLPEAGACGPCPKRMGNQKGLWDQPDEKGSAYVCTDPTCFASKTRAQFEQKRVEFERAGAGEVLQGKKAEAALNSGDLVSLASSCPEDPKGRSYAKLLGKQAVPAVLVEGRDGEAVILVRRAALHAALKKAGTVKMLGTTPARAQSSEEQKRQKAHRTRMAAWKGLQERLLERARDVDPAQAWALVIAHGLQTQAGRRLTDKVALVDMKPADLQALALQIVANDNPSSTWSTNAWAPSARAIALACKIDLAAEVRAAEKVKKAAKPSNVRTLIQRAAKSAKKKGKAAAAGDE